MYHRQHNSWKPGFWARLPWAGLLSILGAVIATAATIAVLTSSNGKPTSEWPTERFPIQPAVILAILTTVANALISWALYDGVVIAWWTKMLRGASLKECHNYWEHGSSAWNAFLAGRDFNKIANACLLAFLVFVDGPLLQRASSIQAQSVSTTANFSAFLSSAPFAANYSGIYMTRAKTVSGITPAMAEVVRDFSSRKPMTMRTTGCTGVCRGELVAPGWDVKCNSSTRAYNITSPTSGDVFNVGYATVYHDKWTPNALTVETAHKPKPGYVGDLILTTCVLHHAIVRYAVEVTNPNTSTTANTNANSSPESPQLSTVTLLPLPVFQNTTITLLSSNRSETSGLGFFPSSLGGFALAAKTIYNSSISIYFTGGTYALDPSTSGPMVYTHVTPGDKAARTADMTWVDPGDDIIAALREMAFRAALGLSVPTTTPTNSTPADIIPNANANTNANATTTTTTANTPNDNRIAGDSELQNLQQTAGQSVQTTTITIYASHYPYLAAAVGLMLLAIAAILPLFAGWWELGREVSLSPLETGRAFEAPLLVGDSRSDGVDDVLDEVGRVRVRYGCVRKEGGERWVVGLEGEEGGGLLG